MDFDDQRFLTLVAEYPCLYDSHDANYKNAESRQICWIDIGNELQCDDIEFLKKKWDISKEKFRRIRKKITRSDQPGLALEWPLYQLMYTYFDQFIKTRNRLCAAEKKELNHSHQSSYQEEQSENSLPVESKLFIGPNPYIHHEVANPVSTNPNNTGGESGETSSIVSPSPASSSGHQSDHIVQTPVHTPKSKKLKRISSETSSSTLLCEAMKLWTDAVQQQTHQIRDLPSNTPAVLANTSTDEITLYCLSYAARLKTLPIEAVDDIRCQMESLMRDARLKYNKM